MRACERACVRTCVRACVRACVRVCVCVTFADPFNICMHSLRLLDLISSSSVYTLGNLCWQDCALLRIMSVPSTSISMDQRIINVGH